MDYCPELLSVITLRHRLDRQGPLSLAEASPLLDQIAEVVDRLHLRGQIHGAVNTGNILLLPGDKIRLLFPKTASDSPHFMGRSGRAFAGDTLYLSPEEVRGEPKTPATDRWCLGALLYEMLTGYPPFFALRLVTLRQMVASDEPELLPVAACPAQPVVDRALAKWPANRYMSAQEMANHLWAAAPGVPQTAVKVPAEVTLPRQTAGRSVLETRRWPLFFRGRSGRRIARYSTSA